MDSSSLSLEDGLRIALAVVLPPLSVFLEKGLGVHFALNVVLTLLGYVAGAIHALWLLLRE